MTFYDLLGLLTLLLIAAAIVIALGVAALLHALLRPPRKTFAVALGQGLATDPGEVGAAFESVDFTLTGGGETPGWIIAGGDPAGPAIVVTHGYGDSRYGALTWTPVLLPHASRVVLYDLRGHGDSESKSAHCGTTDVADLLGIVEQCHPDRPVVLMGYSMGAGIAIAAAAAAPTHAGIVGVIADGPYRQWDEPIRCYFRARRYPAWPIIPLTGLILRLIVRGFAAFDRADHARRLRCPLLVLHGDCDWLCPTDSARQIAQAAAQGQIITFPGGGHLDLAAVDENAYRDAVTSFLNRVRSTLPKSG